MTRTESKFDEAEQGCSNLARGRSLALAKKSSRTIFSFVAISLVTSSHEHGILRHFSTLNPNLFLYSNTNSSQPSSVNDTLHTDAKAGAQRSEGKGNTVSNQLHYPETPKY